MKDMIARKNFWYAGRELKAGETFRTTHAHAKTLELVGHAKTAPVGEKKPILQQSRIVEAQPPQQLQPTRRSYRRRDMTAEEPRISVAESEDGT
jgi:hypothetical protein